MKIMGVSGIRVYTSFPGFSIKAGDASLLAIRYGSTHELVYKKEPTEHCYAGKRFIVVDVRPYDKYAEPLDIDFIGKDIILTMETEFNYRMIITFKNIQPLNAENSDFPYYASDYKEESIPYSDENPRNPKWRR